MPRKKPRSQPLFYPQETPDSCAVACLRSILNFYGQSLTEKSLRELCGTTASGTLSDDLVKCAQALGFQARKEYSNLSSLKQYLSSQHFPIIYLNLLFLKGIDSVHAVVPLELRDQLLLVIDPLEGERSFPLSAFEKSWLMLNNLAIIIEPKPK